MSASTSRSRGVSESRRSRILACSLERGAVARVALEGPLDAIDEILIAEGLLQEVEGALLHGLDRHRDVTVAGDEDDRNDGATQVELLLQLEPAHAGHAHVEHQATRLARLVGLEELARRGEGARREADGFQQETQGVTHAFIVVHDEDRGCRLLHVTRWVGVGSTI